MSQPETPVVWRCRQCGAQIGEVRDGKLIVGQVQLVEGTVICPRCGRTRRFVRLVDAGVNSRPGASAVRSY